MPPKPAESTVDMQNLINAVLTMSEQQGRIAVMVGETRDDVREIKEDMRDQHERLTRLENFRERAERDLYHETDGLVIKDRKRDTMEAISKGRMGAIIGMATAASTALLWLLDHLPFFKLGSN